MKKVVIIALEYEEPEYQQTLDCLKQTDLPIIVAKRDGVGNYSRAFNEAFQKGASEFDYAWMISNIIFQPNAPYNLAEAIEKMGYAAIHPTMPSSDHQHQWPDGSGLVREVPFIEWTAPMVDCKFFSRNMLDEELAYYYMDLAWSYETRRRGWKVGVDHSVEVGHVYLRNSQSEHPISKLRKRLREYWTPRSQARMESLYGKDWKREMQWKG